MKENSRLAFADRLKELRISRGLTQRQLSEETGIGYGTIVNYENLQREPNSKNMARLEKYFNVSGAYLRGETDDPAPQRRRRYHSVITMLDPDLQREVDEMLANSRYTYTDIVQFLKENGIRISVSSICRYAQRYFSNQ